MKLDYFSKKIKNLQSGMTYVEIIVVLSIFSMVSTVVLFNYSDFQAKVDIKNLANDIALKLVEAQKAANFGSLPPASQQSSLPVGWKPSYGVYFNLSSDNKAFTYFTDIDDDRVFDGGSCSGECIETFTITKGNSVSSIDVFYTGNPTGVSFSNMAISFTRPSSEAEFYSTSSFSSTISYVQITIASSQNPTSRIKIYPSGRIQIN